MSAPRIEIELEKISHNATKIMTLCRAKGIRLTAVTKAVCGSPQIAKTFLDSGISSLGDSYIANIQNMRESGIQAQYILLRSPMPSNIQQVVEFADISLNTELSIIRRLGECAAQRGKTHSIILMVELGDLREGILPAEIKATVKETLNIRGINLAGIGTNLACFGGIKPTEQNMQELSDLAEDIQRAHGIPLEFVSGGNSANYQWLNSTKTTGRINHLRIGESILLGYDTTTHQPIPQLYTDAFTLVAEVIEIKTKPSKPYGEPGRDAFGNAPAFEDQGTMRRAILAIGRQDIDPTSIQPRADMQILGASSDHLLLNAKNIDLNVGDEVQFDLQYGALLKAMVSPYVEKNTCRLCYINEARYFSGA